MSRDGAKKTKLVIDTDIGCDDFVALLLAVGSGCFEVMGITTVYGNADTEQTTENALGLLQIPVYKGAKAPWNGKGLTVPIQIHGHNGIGNVALPKNERKAENMSAAEFLVHICNKFPGEVALFFGGPLTNLANALMLDASLPSKWASAGVMGGAFFVPGNIDNFREANFTGDPEAASFVFSRSAGLRVVGLDVTYKCPFTYQDLNEIGDVNANGALLKSIYAFYLDFYKRERVHCDGAPPHDAIGLMALIAPKQFEWMSGPIAINTTESHRGQSTILAGNGYEQSDNVHHVATMANGEAILSYIKQTIKYPVLE